ncbi:uncharacterized protein [Fopius arisanus]|uniref:Uncharacterized protein n=1 Tax=Fopius arisanus TaxID=64838 RepID=A0A9R1TNV0_9HYME|nr:PREDICTED: uncharacterized protein LOC105272155 [Fopius arisanus]
MVRQTPKLTSQNLIDLPLDIRRSTRGSSSKSAKKVTKTTNPKVIPESSSSSSCPSTPKTRPSNQVTDSSSSMTPSLSKRLPKRKPKTTRVILSDDSDEAQDQLLKSSHCHGGEKFNNLDKIKTTDIERGLTYELKEFVKAQLGEIKIELSKKITSAKVSILYNLDQKMNELKLTVLAQNIPQAPQVSLHQLMTAVDTKLPIETLDDFLQFEEQLKNDDKKKFALTALFNCLCFTHPTVKACINHVLPQIMKKAVQSQYSGIGRKVKGHGKLDFSATSTFDCFQDPISSKFKNPNEVGKLSKQVGNWLVHFGDREGGRADRSNMNA